MGTVVGLRLKRRPRTFGHIKGTRVAKTIITACSRRGIKNLTLYAFSTENWFRPQAEVSLLMQILRRYLKRETENLVKENIRFSVIGDMSRIPADVADAIGKFTVLLCPMFLQLWFEFIPACRWFCHREITYNGSFFVGNKMSFRESQMRYDGRTT